MSRASASMRDYYERLEGEFETYRGIPALCEPGLHQAIAQELGKLVPPKSRVLDLGCGRGALSLRLHDLGYSVDACDMFDLCECKDVVKFIPAAAEEAGVQDQYDAVLMIELLQAVESPIGVIRQYADNVRSGGYIFVSVPSVDNDLSRVHFFLRGRHDYFEPHNVTDDGSISPVHEFQVRYAYERSGFDWVGRVDMIERDENIPRGASWAALRLLRGYQRATGKAANKNRISMFVGRKP